MHLDFKRANGYSELEIAPEAHGIGERHAYRQSRRPTTNAWRRRASVRSADMVPVSELGRHDRAAMRLPVALGAAVRHLAARRSAPAAACASSECSGAQARRFASHGSTHFVVACQPAPARFGARRRDPAVGSGRRPFLARIAKRLLRALRGLVPWRKGPFELFGIRIDAEWRSDRKWRRVRPHVDLTGKHVLDVGCWQRLFRLANVGSWRSLRVGHRSPRCCSCCNTPPWLPMRRKEQVHAILVLPLRLGGPWRSVRWRRVDAVRRWRSRWGSSITVGTRKRICAQLARLLPGKGACWCSRRLIAARRLCARRSDTRGCAMSGRCRTSIPSSRWLTAAGFTPGDRGGHHGYHNCRAASHGMDAASVAGGCPGPERSDSHHRRPPGTHASGDSRPPRWQLVCRPTSSWYFGCQTQVLNDPHGGEFQAAHPRLLLALLHQPTSSAKGDLIL